MKQAFEQIRSPVGRVEDGSSNPADSAAVTEAQLTLNELASVFFPVESITEQPGTSSTGRLNRPPSDAAAELSRDIPRYQTLVEQIPAVTFMAFLDKGIGEAYVSPQIEALLGFTQEEWLNDPVRWYQHIHPDDKTRWSAEAAEIFLSGKPLKSTYRVIARDGRVVWFHCEAKMVRREDGRPWFIHGVAFDITELKATENALQKAHDELEMRVQKRTAELAKINEELQTEIAARRQVEQEREQLLIREQAARTVAEMANCAKDEFLATASHELRTPLNAILGWARMLRTGKLDQPTYARAVETIERNAKAQAQLVEDLLDVSRIISGKLRLNLRAVDLVLLIQDALDSVRPAAEAKGIQFDVALDPLAGPASADPDRLQQIVWNLLSNAVKFTPRDGRVGVKLERIDSQIEITVTDTGKGIEPEFLPHVFDRFRQADSSSTRVHGGLGLGLAIVRHLVELHGGTVYAYSAGEGQGASFKVRLPAMIASSSVASLVQGLRRSFPADGEKPLECPPVLEGLKVLVVDDEPDVPELLTLVLSQCGSEVAAVRSAAEALVALRETRPDIILSDVEMPVEDGYSLIRKVRAMEAERGGRLPAVALTAHASNEDRLRALSAGYDSHVTKPVDPEELVTVIATVVRRVAKQ